MAVQHKGATLMVSHARRAAELLLYEWPAPPGPKHRAARAAVLAAMERHMDAKAKAKARKAFAEAVAEAEGN